MKITVIINPVQTFEFCEVSFLTEILNKFCGFNIFIAGPKIEGFDQSHQSFSCEEVINGLQRVVVNHSENTTVFVVGITQVKLDCGDESIVQPRKKVAISSQFDWPQEKSNSYFACRWLYTIFQSSIIFITGRSCINERCIAHNQTNYSFERLLSVCICQSCRRKIINHIKVSGLISLEKALAYLKVVASSNYDLIHIQTLDIDGIQPIMAESFQLKINEAFIKQWVNKKWNLSFTAATSFQMLPHTLYCALSSMSPKPKWDQALSTIIENSKQVDTLLYFTRKRHRDHSRHQFNVAGIGLFLLDTKMSDSISVNRYLLAALNDKHNYSKDRFWDSSVVANSWIVASLLHDSAYSLSLLFEIITNACQEEISVDYVDFEIVDMLLKQSKIFAGIWPDLLSQIKKSIETKKDGYSSIALLLRNQLRSCLDPLINRAPTSIAYPTTGLIISNILDQSITKPELIFDHGLWSAANLLALLLEFDPNLSENLESSTDKDTLALIEAIEAIALHNIKPKEYTVKFKQNPMASFLRFCDQIQEWNRGSFSSGKFLEELDSITLYPIVEVNRRIYIDRKLSILFEYPRINKLFEAEWDLRKFMEPKLAQQIKGFPLDVSFSVSIPFNTETSHKSTGKE